MKNIAKVISYVFHPLLMLTYIAIILLLINPFLFGKSNITQGTWIIIQVVASTFLMPAFAVLLMKNLGLVGSFEMHERTERIIPYIATGMFYLWVFMSVRKNAMFPQIYTVAVLGATIGLFISFFFNNFIKISAHACGVGGLVGLMLITLRWFSYSYFYINNQTATIPVYWVLIVVLLLAGVVCSARLLLGAHTHRELLYGFAAGLVGMWLSAWYLI